MIWLPCVAEEGLRMSLTSLTEGSEGNMGSHVVSDQLL